MLQEFLPETSAGETLGTGVNVCFQCETRWRSIRISNRAESNTGTSICGNTACGLLPVTDPDGYRMEFFEPN